MILFFKSVNYYLGFDLINSFGEKLVKSKYCERAKVQSSLREGKTTTVLSHNWKRSFALSLLSHSQLRILKGFGKPWQALIFLGVKLCFSLVSTSLGAFLLLVSELLIPLLLFNLEEWLLLVILSHSHTHTHKCRNPLKIRAWSF